MNAWLNENWYYFTSLGSLALVLGFYIYVRRHPDGAAAAFWRRIIWTLAGGIAVMMVLMLTTVFVTLIAPELDPIPFFMSAKVYWLEIPVFIGA